MLVRHVGGAPVGRRSYWFTVLVATVVPVRVTIRVDAPQVSTEYIVCSLAGKARQGKRLELIRTNLHVVTPAGIEPALSKLMLGRKNSADS